MPNVVGNPKPSGTIAAQDGLPVGFSMVLREQVARFFSQVIGMSRKSLEECARAGLFSQEMESFENQAFATLGRGQTHHGGDHCAVTVAPQSSSLDAEGIEKGNRFVRSPSVKIEKHVAGNLRGMAVARAVGDQDSKLVLKRRDLTIERVHFVTPPAM